MFCHNCGAKNGEGANFCKKCGTKINSSTVKVEDKTKVQNIVTNPPFYQTTSKKIQALKKKIISNSKASFGVVIGVVVLIILILTPEAKAFYGYYSGNKKANKLFSQGDYSAALQKEKSINQNGLPKSYKNKLNINISKYGQVLTDDQTFATAKQDEQNGDLNNAKMLLVQISGDQEYPNSTGVIKELSSVNDKLAIAAQAAAAAAQKQAAEAAARAKSEQLSEQKAQADAAQAAANAAANQAAAQAAQAAATQQQEQAAAQAAQAAAAQQAATAALQEAQNEADSAYVNAYLSSYKELENSQTELNDGVTAFIDSDFNDALLDMQQAENYSYNAEHNLPSTFSSKFHTLNNDMINAANYYNYAAQAFIVSMENLTSSDSAFSDWKTGNAYYEQISIDANAIQ
jgi:hypothetical protein